jgi:hypothetical protein
MRPRARDTHARTHTHTYIQFRSVSSCGIELIWDPYNILNHQNLKLKNHSFLFHGITAKSSKIVCNETACPYALHTLSLIQNNQGGINSSS